MKKKVLMVILGLMLFIPNIRAKEITKEQYIDELMRYVISFNEFAKNYKYDESVYLSPKKIEPMRIINNGYIILKNDDYETKIEYDETTNQLNVKHDLLPEIDDDSNESEKDKFVEYSKYETFHKEVIFAASLSLKEIDKEIGIDALPLTMIITSNGGFLGVDKFFEGQFNISLNDFVPVKSTRIPTFTIEKIDDNSIKIQPTNTDDEFSKIYLLEYVDGNLYRLHTISDEGEIIDDIDPEKEYMFRATFKGYTYFSDEIYYNKKEQQETENNTTPDKVEKPSTSTSIGSSNVSDTTGNISISATPENPNISTAVDNSNASNTTENPKTGIKTYYTLGFASLIVITVLYKVYKGKMGNI